MGYSPQPPSRYCVPPFPVRRGFITARRSRCVHHPALPSCSHRLRISLFFPRRLALRFHAFEWQLATSPAGSALSYHFPLHDSILADLSTLHFRQSFIVFAPRSISRRLSLTASFRRPFHRYINDLSCAVGSSQEPPCPVHAFYWRTKSRHLRQQPQTTQMPLPSS